MRIAIDATAAAVQGAGVGRYTRELLRSLVTLDDDDAYVLLCAASVTRCRALLDDLPPGTERELRRIPVSERYLTATWHRARLPMSAELLVGAFDVFHGPDFVVPPSKRPRVVTIHDLSFLLHPDLGEPSLVAYLRGTVPRAIRASDRVIAVSASVARELAEAYPWARDRIVAIPNGVRQPPEITPGVTARDRPTVLIVGTIEPRKNHLTLLDAMQHVRSRYPDALLVVAGRVGWQADRIMQRLRGEVSRGHVRFVEGPSDAELEQLYREATVFAYPSRYEGFGLPVLEAMLRGIPVVAGDIAALRETGGTAARYAQIADPEAIADAIVTLFDDTDLAAHCVAAGYQQASRYSWDDTARRTRRVYQQAANRGHDG